MTDELRHHGIIGQKWGVRRYQKSDGSLTAAGKNRYADKQESKAKLAKESASEWREIGKYQTQRLRDKASSATDPRKADRYNRKADRLAKKYERYARNDEYDAKAHQDRANQSRKEKAAREAVKRNMSIGDRLIYSEGTRNRAVSYISKHDLPVDVAIRKAKQDAWKNTALFVTTLAAVSLADTQLKKI